MKKLIDFDKEGFKKEVITNVKTLYRRPIEEATPQQVFQAVSYAVKDDIIDRWIATHKEYEKKNVKTVYYLSMEFLMGRALGNNLINLTYYDAVKEALDELGFDLNLIEDQEPDAALGNGGLGRLAACFLDSLATLGYPAYGCGIRYRYGMFKQEIRDGYQVEVPDNWLMNGNPFELRRPEYAKIVKFGGYVSVHTDENGRNVFTQEGYQSVKAVPFDFPIVGYGNGIVNTLRIWDAEPVECFQLGAVAVIDAVIEDEIRLHHAQLIFQLGPGLALVQGHDDSACHHGAENDRAVLIVGAAQDNDLLALGLAQLLLQVAGRFADILHILSVGLFHHRVLALHIAERHTVSILILHRRDHIKNGHRHICHGHNFVTSLVCHYFALPVYFC